MQPSPPPGAAADEGPAPASDELNVLTPDESSAPSFDDSGAASHDEASGPFRLRVSLYPWIPEPDAFVAWIESDFESKNPDIDLVVRPLVRSYDWEPGYVADLAYETDKAVVALTDEAGDDFQHLVEVDTLTLGALAQSGAIAPFHVGGVSFLPAAKEAVRWDGRGFGVPHWTCGYFVISESPFIRNAGNVGELLAALEGAGTPRVNLAGDMDGSWDSVAIYLDAFRDTYPDADLGGALSQPQIDPAVADYFRDIRPACIKDGVNHCADDAVDLFATGGADALIGFSERLNPILAHPGRAVGELHIASATLGGGDEPAAFVDALVKSSRCTSARCRQAARRFATYYVSDEVFEVSLMALDAQAGVPRYLLPSTKSAFNYGLVAQDRLYKQLKQEFQGARALPNTGVPEAREAGLIRQQLREALGL
ncbi:MAG TPA: hypothetical protein VFS43_10225 [Polyangiaceae bacterium]|nr:hypothetical protein [Polyangiaceae bacterium]